MVMTKELEEANAAFAAKQEFDRDNPTGDPEEDAFLRAFRSALDGATQDKDVTGAIVLDSPVLGEVWIDFHDPDARHVVISTVRVEGSDVPLSVKGKQALLAIVKEHQKSTAIDTRAEQKSAALAALVAKVEKAK